MSGLFNPTSQNSAIDAGIAAINQQLVVTPFEWNVVGAIVTGTQATLGMLVLPNQRNRKLVLTNNNTIKRFKFMLAQPPLSAAAGWLTFADHFLGILEPGGNMEITDPEIRAGVWGWCSDPAGGAIDTVFSAVP
jgi:hypothetical protein